ncbi:MAG: HD domain-containing protein [Clostridiaceae bacterium]|nr:HD domain-containing protein [Clostridiaceae bacterium]
MKSIKKDTYFNLTKHDFSLEILIHSSNVANIALKIADAIDLCNSEKPHLYEAALYHDIGKSKVPEFILYKKGSLSTKERSIMMKHAIHSQELYLSVESLGDETIKIAKAIRHHHENWDGTGYPDKISRKDIPLHSRIIKIADMFEAMIQPRVYRTFRIHNTLEIMEQMQGKELDPEIFKKSYDILYELLVNNQKENSTNWQSINVLNG